jgi:DNA-3-methyladenine glycosylase
MAMVLASKIHQVVNLREVLESDVEKGAMALIGCNLILEGRVAQIVETEAYTWDDPGCHAYRRESMKNMAMYGEPGTAYVYFTYGNHWMINVVADRIGRPGAVLIRSAIPVAGLDEFRSNRPNISNERDLLSGPGRLTKGFGIDNQYNSVDLLDQRSGISIAQSTSLHRIGVSRRIGIAEGKGDGLLRRFVDLDQLVWATAHKFNRELSTVS